MPRYARKVDSNHADIVADLRRLGMSVTDTSAVGEGFPDLVVGWRGITLLVEVKRKEFWTQPKKRGRVQAKTDEQQARFASEWKGLPVVRAFAAEQIVQMFDSWHKLYWRREA